MLVLTSLCRGPRDEVVRRALASWAAAGLTVRSFNHPSEIAALEAADLGAVEYVPVTETSHVTFGRHYVPVNRLLDWAAANVGDEPVMISNSDIELRLTPADVDRAAAQVGSHGLLIMARHDHPVGHPDTVRQTCCGFDVFMLSAQHADLFKPSFLSLGQAWWDYWLPLTFIARGLPIYGTTECVALHEEHDGAASWSASWQRCGGEAQRLLGVAMGNLGNGGAEYARILAHRQLVSIAPGLASPAARIVIPSTMPPSSSAPFLWPPVAVSGGLGGQMGALLGAGAPPLLPVVSPPVLSEFDEAVELLTPLLAGTRRATVLELGAYDGVATARLLALLPDPPRAWYAWEPDPRNLARCSQAAVYRRPGVCLVPAAVAAVDGEAVLHLSTSADRGDWSESSTLRDPAPAMAQDVPWLKYAGDVSVITRSLDSFSAEHGLDVVDLIWCDVEGAEALMIAGGPRTLARTRYLFCEAWDRPIYAGALTPEELLAALPGWELVARLPHDVLLRNAALTEVA